MFTGIVTDLGEVRSVDAARRQSASADHRLRLPARRVEGGRLDRLFRRLPDGGRRRRGGRPRLVCGRRRRGDAARHHGRALAPRHARQSRAAAQIRRRARRPPGRRPCRRRRAGDRARGHDRHGALRAARAGRARAFHRAERLGRARRRLAHRQRGRRRHLLGADHPAHACRSPPSARSPRATNSISRSTPWRATPRG